VPSALRKLFVTVVKASVPAVFGRFRDRSPEATGATTDVLYVPLDWTMLTPPPETNVGVVISGLPLKTSFPAEPVASVTTPRSWEEVVVAKYVVLSVGNTQEGAVPVEIKVLLVLLDALKKVVVPLALWYKTLPAAPPLTLVARSD
jgi:hypothetical protein